MTKTIIVFVIAIAIAGFLVYKYVVEDEECPRSPATGQCMGTTTGYETPTVRGGGDRGGGGGGDGIEIQVP